MSNDRIHAAYCRCHQCAPRHPSAADISPVLRIVFLAAAIGVGLAFGAWAGAVLANSLSSWS
ncbi:hypothetical protein NRB_26560 [Novosphingobium sp. 11B]